VFLIFLKLHAQPVGTSLISLLEENYKSINQCLCSDVLGCHITARYQNPEDHDLNFHRHKFLQITKFLTVFLSDPNVFVTDPLYLSIHISVAFNVMLRCR